LSLTKYLMIAAENDAPDLDVYDVSRFLQHVLERIDWRRDLHFHTCTTIDTLDYTGAGLNQGSKVVIAAAGPKQRELPVDVPGDLRLPDGFGSAKVCLPGVLAVEGPPCAVPSEDGETALSRFCCHFDPEDRINRFPLVLIVDDSEFTAGNLDNLLWVVFTRSDPAGDIDGIAASVHQKHWGCAGSLVIDARIKPHHAPPLIEDPEVSKRVDARAARGGPLARYL
jgi:4-hydroxy-3-polyprenylbenzoate decarboxylase